MENVLKPRLLDAVRENQPLVHAITNLVSMSDCAQAIRATGALPVFAHDPAEVGDMADTASALVVNIGTSVVGVDEAISTAVRRAAALGLPVVFDPIGAGATPYRRDLAHRIMEEADPSVISGNAAEIAVLSGGVGRMLGAESVGVEGDVRALARSLALESGAVVVVSGKTDLVTDGERIVSVRNGHPLMGMVVGTGSVRSAVLGAFVAVADKEELLAAATTAVAYYGVAGEIAATGKPGPGTFRIGLADALHAASPDDVARGAIVDVEACDPVGRR